MMAEPNIKEVTSKNNTKKKIIVGLSIFLISIVAISSFAINKHNKLKAYVETYANKVYPGVTINGEDVGGKTREEVEAVINSQIESIKSKQIIVNIREEEFTIPYSEFNVSSETNSVIEEALKYGKDGELYEKKAMIDTPKSKSLTYTFNFDNSYVEQFVNSKFEEYQTDATNARIEINGDTINITNGNSGNVINIEKLTADINSKIGENVEGDLIVEAEFVETTPRIKSEDLAKINGVIGTFSTSLGSSSIERRTNVSMGAKYLNGTILMPGDVFSFNDYVGDSTIERGYMSAPVYVGNKVEQGIGGGICQVSTTLYNSVMGAGIPSVERRNHSMPVSYAPLGQDATIAYGYIDYKFANIYSAPVYIQAYTTNSELVIRVWSDTAVKGGYTYQFSQDIYDSQNYTTIFKEDPSLPAGTQKLDVPGSNMKKVRTSWIKKDSSGNIVSNEVISDDIYILVNEVILVGTAPQ